MEFRRATKEQSKLRLAIFGPSGAGKTYTALRLATGMGGRIALIDTERGSASKYADKFSFDVLDLPKKDIATYCAAIDAAARAGYEILIIDSLTHAWHDLLNEVDRLARAKFGGNTWAAWSEGTPKQRGLVDSLLAYPGHIVATMRTKTEWVENRDDRGKVKYARVGLAPEQGKGIEYEFDLLMEISADHLVTIIKDRTSRFQDRMIEMPGEELGRELAEWLNEGIPPRERPEPAPAPTRVAPAPAPAKVQNGANELDDALGRTANGNGDHADEPPARSPQELLKVVNSRVEVPFDDLRDMGRVLKSLLGENFRLWPAQKDTQAWRAAYDAAVAYARSLLDPTPALDQVVGLAEPVEVADDDGENLPF